MTESNLLGAVSLDDPNYHIQLRLGLQGKGGTGKTFVTTKFRNPVSLSFDRGLVAHIGKSGIIEIPFYDTKFVNSLCPPESPMYVDPNDERTKPRPPNRKDALPKWLYEQGPKLSKDNTVVFDNGSSIQAAYHVQYRTNPAVSKKGDENKFTEWRWKLDYFTELMMIIKGLPCDAIWLMHEQDDRDKQGNLNGQLRPLMSGAFVDEIIGHFTDWYRALSIEKPFATQDKTIEQRKEDLRKKFNLPSIETVNNWINSTPSNHSTIYIWQTQGDEFAQCKCSLMGCPKYVLASPEVFKQYQRQPEKIE